jgi:D-alanyl-D-alanine endopeptidase (penicillin-binding protein 7)
LIFVIFFAVKCAEDKQLILNNNTLGAMKIAFSGMNNYFSLLCVFLAAASLPAWAAGDLHKTTAKRLQYSSKPISLPLRSGAVLVLDQETGEPLLSKNMDQVLPIASITKLMTAMVILDSDLPLLESISIEKGDVDRMKGSRSKLAVGTTLMRAEMLKLALMASENRAAAALARNFPGGTPAFVVAMNQKSAELGMSNSRFVDATGLHPGNVSTAGDLAKMAAAAHRYPLIREYTTTDYFRIESEEKRRRHVLAFVNSNRLLKSRQWEIGLSKTGYISEAGRCLVMQAMIGDKPRIIVLLDSWGKLSRIGDANRIKRWIEADATRVRG